MTAKQRGMQAWFDWMHQLGMPAKDPTDLTPLTRKPKAKAAVRTPLWTCPNGHRTLAHRETCVCGERRT